MLTIEELFERSVKECLVKNFVVVVLGLLFYDDLGRSLSSVTGAEMGDFLMLVSILLVTACFANFAFSYEFSIMESLGMRLLSHISTFIFMLLIALLLEIMVIGIQQVYPKLQGIVITLCLLLYSGCALYDFWDLFRGFKALYPELSTRPPVVAVNPSATGPAPSASVARPGAPAFDPDDPPTREV